MMPPKNTTPDGPAGNTNPGHSSSSGAQASGSGALASSAAGPSGAPVPSGAAGPSGKAGGPAPAAPAPAAPAPAAPTPSAPGPGNWPATATLTRLSARERERYQLLLDTANLIQRIHITLPNYKGPNRVTKDRWPEILRLFTQFRSEMMTNPSNPGSLDSTFQQQKTVMKGLIALNASQAAPPPRTPLPNAPVRSHGGRRIAGTAPPRINRVENLDVKAQWADINENDHMGPEEVAAVDATADAAYLTLFNSSNNTETQSAQ